MMKVVSALPLVPPVAVVVRHSKVTQRELFFTFQDKMFNKLCIFLLVVGIIGTVVINVGGKLRHYDV